MAAQWLPGARSIPVLDEVEGRPDPPDPHPASPGRASFWSPHYVTRGFLHPPRSRRADPVLGHGVPGCRSISAKHPSRDGLLFRRLGRGCRARGRSHSPRPGARELAAPTGHQRRHDRKGDCPALRPRFGASPAGPDSLLVGHRALAFVAVGAIASWTHSSQVCVTCAGAAARMSHCGRWRRPATASPGCTEGLISMEKRAEVIRGVTYVPLLLRSFTPSGGCAGPPVPRWLHGRLTTAPIPRRGGRAPTCTQWWGPFFARRREVLSARPGPRALARMPFHASHRAAVQDLHTVIIVTPRPPGRIHPSLPSGH